MKELDIKIIRSEQWEWAAMGYGLIGRESNESMAELDLLRKILKEKNICSPEQRKFLNKIEAEGREYCYEGNADDTSGTWEIGNRDTKIQYYSDDIVFNKVIRGE